MPDAMRFYRFMIARGGYLTCERRVRVYYPSVSRVYIVDVTEITHGEAALKLRAETPEGLVYDRIFRTRPSTRDQC